MTRLLASYTRTQSAGQATLTAYLMAVQEFSPRTVAKAVDDWMQDHPSTPPQAPELAERCRLVLEDGEARQALPAPATPLRERLLENAQNLEMRALRWYGEKLPPNIEREVAQMRRRAAEC